MQLREKQLKNLLTNSTNHKMFPQISPDFFHMPQFNCGNLYGDWEQLGKLRNSFKNLIDHKLFPQFSPNCLNFTVVTWRFYLPGRSCSYSVIAPLHINLWMFFKNQIFHRANNIVHYDETFIKEEEKYNVWSIKMNLSKYKWNSITQ